MEVFLFFFLSKWRAWHVVIGRGVGRVVAAPAQQNDWMPWLNAKRARRRLAVCSVDLFEVRGRGFVSNQRSPRLLTGLFFFFACPWLFRLWPVWSDATRWSLAEHGVVINSIQLEVKKFDWLLEESWEKNRCTFFFGERVLFQVDTKRLLPFTASNKNIQNRLRARNNFLIDCNERI